MDYLDLMSQVINGRTKKRNNDEIKLSHPHHSLFHLIFEALLWESILIRFIAEVAKIYSAALLEFTLPNMYSFPIVIVTPTGSTNITFTLSVPGLYQFIIHRIFRVLSVL